MWYFRNVKASKIGGKKIGWNAPGVDSGIIARLLIWNWVKHPPSNISTVNKLMGNCLIAYGRNWLWKKPLQNLIWQFRSHITKLNSSKISSANISSLKVYFMIKPSVKPIFLQQIIFMRIKSVYPMCHFVFLINWKTEFKFLDLDFAFTSIKKTKFK